MINCVIFCGGRGSNTVIQSLLKVNEINLTIVTNAYDDGLSTGQIRESFNGLLGPSDIRKNFSNILPMLNNYGSSLSRFFEDRLKSELEISKFFGNIKKYKNLGFYDNFMLKFPVSVNNFLIESLQDFDLNRDKSISLNEVAIGNMIIAGSFTKKNNFNSAIDELNEKLLDSYPIKILNSTEGENLYLSATLQDGSVYSNEAAIVRNKDRKRIINLYLTEIPVYEIFNFKKNDDSIFLSKNEIKVLESSHFQPRTNIKVIDAIKEADVIIYGPGTPHSSLLPTFLSQGLVENLTLNSRAKKIFLGNIELDLDSIKDSQYTLFLKFKEIFSRYVDINTTKIVNYYFDPSNDEYEDHNKFVDDSIINDYSFYSRKEYKTKDKKHTGDLVVSDMLSLISQNKKIHYSKIYTSLSIIIPVKNEEKKLPLVLDSILQNLVRCEKYNYEVIVVDGGSDDKTRQIMSSYSFVDGVFLDAAGRGEVIKKGISLAKGQIVAIFHGDNEYNFQDLMDCVDYFSKGNSKIVFGSRNLKQDNPYLSLKYIYEERIGHYIVSLFGGLVLSLISILKYKRWVSDPLTGIKIFDNEFLRSNVLKSNDLDFDLELIYASSKRRVPIIEYPVSYKPRKYSDGKKSSILQGLKALLKFLFGRF